GLLEDGDDLTVGVTGRLHAELSKIIFRKFYSFQRLFAGGITERLSTAIMYCSADTIIGLSHDRTITHWNPAASRLFGYSDSEMVGQSIEKLIPNELRDENDLHFLTATYAKVTDTAFDTKRRHADGHLIDVSISIAPILGGEGELLGFTKMYRDITQKIKSAEALEKSEALFRTLSEFSPLGIFSTDLDGNCLYTNRRWQEIYGLTFEQSLGQGWLTPLHPDDAEQIAEEWRHAALLNGKFDFEFRLLKKDGSVSYVHSRSSELKVGELVTGYVGIVEDVTIRKLNEETLRKSQSFLDRTGSLA
ncbi:PAS domain-containing protein, partial [Undibacterium sp. Xuan67W]|uniref:PAS domain-containing protein n=1 Tax=Undibacterium sp. Xuan67W TaxID=3413057 RepID=UPI003BF3A393